jgi:fumarate hydratase, class II
MGEVLVPAAALYGAQTQRAIDNFTIAARPLPWPFLAAILRIKAAAAATNHQLGLLDETAATEIVRAVEELLRNPRPDQFPVSVYQTGSGTSSNMNANEVIAGMARHAGVPLSANDQVNLGQSSNDVIPSAIHLSAAAAAVATLLPALSQLSGTIREAAREHHGVIKTGRTHLMDALPMRLSAELEAWACQIDESYERLDEALARLQRLPLGGTAIGSGVNCHRDFADLAIARLGEMTGLKLRRALSAYKGLASLDTVVEFSGHLKCCAVALQKIANDLRWMNSGPLAGLGEIRLPALQPGSSIMPAKVNPVVPEAVCMACAQVIGNDTTIGLAALGGNFQLNTMLPLAAAALLESIELLAGSAASLGNQAIRGMVVNTAACRRALALNPILVTALTPLIGYLRAAEIAKISQQEGRTVLEVALEQTDIPREKLIALLDPKILADGGQEER